MNIFIKYILIVSVIFQAGVIRAEIQSDAQIAVITQAQGRVRVLTHPSRELQSHLAGSHVLYEGEYYLAKEAQVGSKVDDGNIVQALPGAKAKLVYPNGDQIYVASSTSYRIFFKEHVKPGETQINLMYGKLRGVIEKGGPRSRLYVRSKEMVMGVRGTDFFIAQGGVDDSTEISVLRGAVEVVPVANPVSVTPSAKGSSKGTLEGQGAPTTQEAEKPKAIEVKAGYSVDIGATLNPSSHEALPVVELRRTTQEEVVGIQKSSVIEKPRAPASEESKEEAKKPAVDPDLQKRIEDLEKKAISVTIQDIKTSDQTMFAKIENLNVKSVEELNHVVMENLVKEAPKAAPKSTRKPFKSELDDAQSGAYDKYFKDI